VISTVSHSPAAIAAAARRTGIMNEQPSTEARRNLYNAAANTGKNWTPTARAVYNHNATTGKPLDIKISDRELPGMDREQIAELVEKEMAKLGPPAPHVAPAATPDEAEMAWRRDLINRIHNPKS
jgi:hypothetical protein